MARIIIVGIYKITSPKGRIYVGQSIDIEKRFARYRHLTGGLLKQTRLARSLSKYGWNNHKFEVIKLCNEDDLNFWERFYITAFDCFDTDHGLNLTSGGEGHKASKETRMKISENMKNRSPELKKRAARVHIGNTYRSGIKHTDEVKEKIRASKIGTIVSDKTRERMSFSQKNKEYRHSSDTCKLMSERSSCKRQVIDQTTGDIFDSVKEAADRLGMKRKTLSAMLAGQNKNKTNLIYKN